MRNPFTQPHSRLLKGVGVVAAAAMAAGIAAWSVPSAAAADTTPPAPPTELTVTPDTTQDGKVILSWKAPRDKDVAYYQIFRIPESREDLIADEVSYLGRTEGTETRFEDVLPSEGSFRYAVMAVDLAQNASRARGWVEVKVDFDENGIGTVTPDTTGPAKPAGLEADDPFTQDRTVDLFWDPLEDEDLWRYLVYRTDTAGSRIMLGYVNPDVTSLTDKVPGESTYTYVVLAQDLTGNLSEASESISVVVDDTDPVVKIASPKRGHTYKGDDELIIKVTITDAGSGYADDAVEYILDGKPLTTSIINLKELDDGVHTLKVTVTDKAGNTGSDRVRFYVNDVVDDALAPQGLTVAEYSRTREVALDWSEPKAGEVDRYVVYRIEPDGSELKLAVLDSDEIEYNDRVSADGEYSYYVVVEHKDGRKAVSELATTVVDTAAPTIVIKSPAEGKVYGQDDDLDIKVAITDETAGYSRDAVSFLLDGKAFRDDEIDLEDLSVGKHTFKVEVTDRAGNQAAQSVTFEVAVATDDDDDEDEDDQGGQYSGLIQVLAKNQAKIHHGHYNALLAKLQAGNIKGFVAHVVKFRGKFIAPEAADELLAAVADLYGDQISPTSWPKCDSQRDDDRNDRDDDDDWEDDRFDRNDNDDDDDDHDDGWWKKGNNGNGKGNGKGNNGKGNGRKW